MSEEISVQEELSRLEMEVQAGEEELVSLQRRLRVATAEASAAANPMQFRYGVPAPTSRVPGMAIMTGLLSGAVSVGVLVQIISALLKR